MILKVQEIFNKPVSTRRLSMIETDTVLRKINLGEKKRFQQPKSVESYKDII